MNIQKKCSGCEEDIFYFMGIDDITEKEIDSILTKRKIEIICFNRNWKWKSMEIENIPNVKGIVYVANILKNVEVKRIALNKVSVSHDENMRLVDKN